MNNLNWNEIYTNISPKLLGICRRYIKDIATAEDIIQDSFIVAIQKENTLKDKNALNGWLSRIVINMAIHHLKEAKKVNFSTHQDYEIVDSTTVMNTLELDPKSILLSSDLERNDILDAIDKLPEHHKSVFNMYVIDQFSHNEISNALNISVGTSKSHLSRARKAIQVFLLEKIKGKPVDEKKKRRIAFLFFLGFGNQMFANFYRNQFEGFEIQSQKSFAFESKKIQFPHQFIGLTKTAFASKIIIATICSLIITATFFYVYTYNSKQISFPKEEKTIIEAKNENPNNESITVPIDSIKKEKPISEINQPKVISTSKKIISTNKKLHQDQAKPIATTAIDSSKSEPQKVVVIKKQIIKKDTVYVTK
ncbi:RNA polymerase sigma factor (sigma-70 family) [Flavobacterium arsenatis]|uniref:RNA polymerase sigma factor (Sigma-70 family) n=1 Tax=Flavobacterium arsenatis TaxID=1484332 RepID=A0ABU1TN96_9FLAO|nr:sigma-70 family RNA polymerase sigma factor [Flavobacterium arsenatis]MDR6966907.1 RNA polymerase sigma factor (sigma-70 family) [Flavobacterium arsenatis]